MVMGYPAHDSNVSDRVAWSNQQKHGESLLLRSLSRCFYQTVTFFVSSGSSQSLTVVPNYMRDLARTYTLLLILGLHPSVGAARPASCETLCADLNASIQRQPERMTMWIEDAIVINQACASELVTAAIDAVSADPEKVRIILETAINVAPNRARQIHDAAKRFAVPTAALMPEVVEEIRRAEVPDRPSEPVIEIRRALAADVKKPQPIEEIRRAVVVNK